MASRRIVVINDSPEFLETVRDILVDGGYEVAAHTGDALTADAIARLLPDLVILDLVLRGRSELASGWDLLLLLRAHADLASVPVIVCSADRDQLRKREHELERIAGVFVLAKPFNLEQLESVVRDALGESASEAC